MHLTSSYHWLKHTKRWNFRILELWWAPQPFKIADKACIFHYSQWKINSFLQQPTQFQSNDKLLKKCKLLASKLQFWTKGHSFHRGISLYGIITTCISHASQNCPGVHSIKHGDRIATSSPSCLMRRWTTCCLAFETKGKYIEGRAEQQLFWPTPVLHNLQTPSFRKS